MEGERLNEITETKLIFENSLRKKNPKVSFKPQSLGVTGFYAEY